jgi:hypothetical protein
MRIFGITITTKLDECPECLQPKYKGGLCVMCRLIAHRVSARELLVDARDEITWCLANSKVRPQEGDGDPDAVYVVNRIERLLKDA